jgi:Ca2+-binding RTX toxin-like protein
MPVFVGNDSRNDTIFGSDARDTILGGPVTGGGNDYLVGAAGADSIDGGNGNDTLVGGDDDDTLLGGDGNDVLLPGFGRGNTLMGGNGDDTVFGDGGDVLNYNKFPGVTRSFAKNLLMGGDGNDFIWGGDNDETLIGGDGNDFLYGQAGEDWLYGGNGNDTLGDTGYAGVLGKGPDNRRLFGEDGNDVIVDGLGNDTVDGGDGNDLIKSKVVGRRNGANGSDAINGGAGIDTLQGAYVAGSKPLVIVYNAATGSGTLTIGSFVDTFKSIEAFDVMGTGFNDVLAGGTGNDTFIGGNGNDDISGGDGIDTVSYTTAGGAVTVNLNTGRATGSAGNDVLSGFERAIGGGFNDVLIGNSSNNLLAGGDGADTLTGGQGSDQFFYERVYGSTRRPKTDTITDFVSGSDKIVVDGTYFAGLAAGVLNASNFVLGTVANAARPQFIYDAVTNNLIFDSNGVVAGNRVVIANFANNPLLSRTDILIV